MSALMPANSTVWTQVADRSVEYPVLHWRS